MNKSNNAAKDILPVWNINAETYVPINQKTTLIAFKQIYENNQKIKILQGTVIINKHIFFNCRINEFFYVILRFTAFSLIKSSKFFYYSKIQAFKQLFF
jgi:hypothetical protein